MNQARYVSRRAASLTESVTLAMTFRAKAMQAEGLDIIGLGAGELHFPTPAGIIDAAAKAARAGATRYTPVPGTAELRQIISNRIKSDSGLDYGIDEILVSNGAKQSIFNALSVLLNPGDKIVVPTPCWLSYPEMISFLGAEMLELPTAENGFRIDTGRLDSLCQGATGILVNSPSNPSGAVINRVEMEALAQAAIKHDLILISDEIYSRLCYEGQHISPASIDGMKERTILINGVSKSHAMTGWRIGYAAGPVALIKAMSRFQAHTTSNACSVSQAAAAAAVRDFDGDVVKMSGICREQRDSALKAALEIPEVRIAPAEGAFYLFIDIRSYLDVGDGPCNDIQLAEYLLEKHHVAVVPGQPFRCPGFIRISYAGDISRILEGINRIKRGLLAIKEMERGADNVG